MWDKIKDVIIHRVVGRSLAAGAAAAVTYVTQPSVVAKLAAIGVTVDPTKLSPAIVLGGTFVLSLIYNYIDHRVNHPTDPPASSATVTVTKAQ